MSLLNYYKRIHPVISINLMWKRNRGGHWQRKWKQAARKNVVNNSFNTCSCFILLLTFIFTSTDIMPLKFQFHVKEVTDMLYISLNHVYKNQFKDRIYVSNIIKTYAIVNKDFNSTLLWFHIAT